MLTDQQKADCRRWMGFAVSSVYVAVSTDQAYLDARLAALTVPEESILTDTYLAKLATLEQAITDAGANLDTAAAGPWTANPREVAQRTALFNQWRREMCAFLGFRPGPGLGDGSATLERC